MCDLLRGSEAWSWGLSSSSMVAFRPGRLSVQDVRSWLDRMSSVVDQFPDEVWRRYEKGWVGMIVVGASMPWYAAMPGYLVPVLVIAFVIIRLVLSRRKRDQREQQTQEAARANGWRWTQTDEALMNSWTLEPFGNGRRPAVRNVVSGEHNRWSFVVFDYEYTTGSGRSSRRHDKVVYVLTLPDALPRIQAGQEGIFGGRVAHAFGRGDLQIGDEELDRTWKIQTEDEAFGRAVFNDQMRQLFRQTGVWTWGIEGDSMVSTHDGHLTAEEIRPQLDLMATVIGQIPDETWVSYAART